MQEIPETIEWKSYAKESSLQFLQSAVTCWPCNWHTAEMFRLVLLLLFIYWRLNFCSGLLLRNDLLLHGISANIHCRCDFWMSKNHCTNIVYISDIIFVCVCVWWFTWDLCGWRSTLTMTTPPSIRKSINEYSKCVHRFHWNEVV